jgi:surface protein
MSTSHDIVSAELTFRKGVIFAGSLFLTVIAAITITSLPSRMKSSRDVLLLRRSLLLSKGPGDPKRTAPRKCFDNTTELYDAVDNFMLGQDAVMAELDETYGLPIGYWCVSKIQNMTAMFSSDRNPTMTDFNEDLEGWDTSNVSTMVQMFDGATSFNKDIGDWGTGKVSRMRLMFYQAASFNQDISSWDTASVEDTINMFFSATSFNQNLCAWGEKLRTNDASVNNMFDRSSGQPGCTNRADPDLYATPPGPFCYDCI